jgi:hypothetical protein
MLAADPPYGAVSPLAAAALASNSVYLSISIQNRPASRQQIRYHASFLQLVRMSWQKKNILD